MSDDLSISSDLPVEGVEDVAAEWSPDVYDPALNQPIVQAIQLGQAAMLMAYQDAAETAANQSDPLYAEEEYLDEIGWEYGVHRQKSELDDPYRARLFHEDTVSPESIIAAANSVLAPYTATSCVYFEHLDGWHVREDFLDLVSASNTTPIVVSTRFPLPFTLASGSSATVSAVQGNTAANGAWTVSVVMGPLVGVTPDGSAPPSITLSGTPATARPVYMAVTDGGPLGTAVFIWIDGTTVHRVTSAATIALTGTGLTAHLPAATYLAGTYYRAGAAGLSLVGSVGSGAYTGGGSVLLAIDDPSVYPNNFSSHVYDEPYGTQNYPDRHYADLPHRFSAGARAFSDLKARLFWLLAPDISAVDASVAGLFDGYLDIVGVSNTTPIEVATRFPLPAEVVTGAEVTIADTRKVLSGGSTFHVTHGSLIVTATGSHFTTELHIGSPITFEGSGSGTYTVLAIGSDTSLDIAPVYGGTTVTNASASSPVCDGTWTVTVTGPQTFTLTGSAAFAGNYADGGSVQTSVPYTADGFYASTGITLVGSIVVVHGTTGVLDATHQLATVRSSTGSTAVHLPSSPSDGENAAVEDVDGQATTFSRFLFVSSAVPFENPLYPGTFVSAMYLGGTNLYVLWRYMAVDNVWVLSKGESYVWSIASIAADVYDAVVSNVNAIRGQSMRWTFWVDPKLH